MMKQLQLSQSPLVAVVNYAEVANVAAVKNMCIQLNSFIPLSFSVMISKHVFNIYTLDSTHCYFNFSLSMYIYMYNHVILS